MKLVIEHHPWIDIQAAAPQRGARPYRVFLDSDSDGPSLDPVATFATEEEARGWCEARVRGEIIAVYELWDREP